MRQLLSLTLVLAVTSTAAAEYRDAFGSPYSYRNVGLRPFFRARSVGVIDGSSIPTFVRSGFAIGSSGFGLAPEATAEFRAARQRLADQAAARRNRLRPIRNAKYAELRAQIVAEREARTKQRLAARAREEFESKARTWTDASGRYRVVAELVSADDRSVQLKRASGALIDVPLAKLSRVDQRFIATIGGDAKPTADEKLMLVEN